jgi:hypothetical protein
LFGKPEGMWEVKIIVGVREMIWEVVDWIRLAQDRDQWRTLVNTVMKGG